jgi:hypothetical protein
MLNKRQELASSEKIGNLVTRESVVKIITDKFPTILKVTIRKFIRIEFGNVNNGEITHTIYRKNYFEIPIEPIFKENLNEYLGKALLALNLVVNESTNLKTTMDGFIINKMTTTTTTI